MHAVSQGALGVECRRDDTLVIEMLNELNDEETVLRCIAERTFLAKLEGGCSAPIAVESKVTASSIVLEGAVFDLEGTRRIYDKFEINFDKELTTAACPVLNNLTRMTTNNKRKFENDHDHDDHNDESNSKKKVKQVDEKKKAPVARKHYSFICDLKIDECKLIKSELCGLHLAERLKEKGADVLINEIKSQINKSFS